jgi:hypothetical protein
MIFQARKRIRESRKRNKDNGQEVSEKNESNKRRLVKERHSKGIRNKSRKIKVKNC